MIGDEFVDLFAGAECIRIPVPKGIPCERLPYFNAMFDQRSGFKEAQEGCEYFPGYSRTFDALLE
jgi:hypothetical protein